MRHAREELIVICDVQGGDHAVGVGLQLGSQGRVSLRGDDLYGDGDGVDFFLGQKRGVGGRDAVDEVLAWVWIRFVSFILFLL